MDQALHLPTPGDTGNPKIPPKRSRRRPHMGQRAGTAPTGTASRIPIKGDRLRRIPAGQSGTAAGPSRRPIASMKEGDSAASAHRTLSVKIAPIDVRSGRTDASAQDESFGYLAFAADLERRRPDRLSARYVRIRRCRDHWMQRHRLASNAPGLRERKPAAPSDRRAGG